ncbi:MAG: hypothetical protein ACLP5V_12050 [Candidatus Bathyarchaeia archaeon]
MGVLTTVKVDTDVLTTVVITDVVEALDVELNIDEDTDVVAIELELELKLVRVVALVEFVACSDDANFGDSCKALRVPRAVV